MTERDGGARFGFGDIRTGRIAPAGEAGGEAQRRLERAATDLGFGDAASARKPPAVEVRNRKAKPAGPTKQFNFKANPEDINRFVAWCDELGVSYRDGFKQLLDLGLAARSGKAGEPR